MNTTNDPTRHFFFYDKFGIGRARVGWSTVTAVVIKKKKKKKGTVVELDNCTVHQCPATSGQCKRHTETSEINDISGRRVCVSSRACDPSRYSPTEFDMAIACAELRHRTADWSLNVPKCGVECPSA